MVNLRRYSPMYCLWESLFFLGNKVYIGKSIICLTKIVLEFVCVGFSIMGRLYMRVYLGKPSIKY